MTPGITQKTTMTLPIRKRTTYHDEQGHAELSIGVRSFVFPLFMNADSDDMTHMPSLTLLRYRCAVSHPAPSLS